MNNKPKIFVIMPFQDDFFEVYKNIKEKFENDFDFSHAADEGNQQSILADIIQPIYDADIILADLTGLNPNVMYELGIAHTFNKKTIIITQDELSNLPFDLKSYRAKDYSLDYRTFKGLLEHLETNFNGAITGDIIFSNPVKDFIKENEVYIDGNYLNDRVIVEIPDGEKGFLDFLEDIEENTKNLTDKITDMNNSMQEMSVGVAECSNQLDRINKPGGTGNTFLMKKQVQKAADYISSYDKSLELYNIEHEKIWDKIENNVLGLLDNKFAQTEENKQGLIEYLYSLNGLKAIIGSNINSMSDMKEASLGNLGIEKSLTHAIKSLDKNLETYLDLLNATSVSIYKILAKSKFVVGDVDFNAVSETSQDEQSS